MSRITDMHSHILPNLDDGPDTVRETMEVLREAERQHINRIIVTPHFHPGRYMSDAEQIFNAVDSIQTLCEENEIAVKLYPGQECYYYSGLLEQLERGNALTLVGSRYVLIEFEPDCLFHLMQYAALELRQSGYMPIIAHFERYRCIQCEEHFIRLKQLGCLFQMNFDTLLQKGEVFHKNPWRKHLQQGHVDYLGSDCHGMKFRPLRVKPTCEWMQRHVQAEEIDRILYQNIQNIFDGGLYAGRSKCGE